jgi:hypothetical protein
MIVTVAFMIMVVMPVIIMLMPMVIMAMLVTMVMIVMRMVIISPARARRSLARKRRNRIAKAGHFLLDRLEIAAAVVAHRHRARRHRYGDVFDAGHTPDGRIDFRCAGGAIHAANPVPCLCCFAHDVNPCL